MIRLYYSDYSIHFTLFFRTYSLALIASLLQGHSITTGNYQQHTVNYWYLLTTDTTINRRDDIYRRTFRQLNHLLLNSALSNISEISISLEKPFNTVNILFRATIILKSMTQPKGKNVPRSFLLFKESNS